MFLILLFNTLRYQCCPYVCRRMVPSTGSSLSMQEFSWHDLLQATQSCELTHPTAHVQLQPLTGGTPPRTVALTLFPLSSTMIPEPQGRAGCQMSHLLSEGGVGGEQWNNCLFSALELLGISALTTTYIYKELL